MIAVDTNILAYAHRRDSEFHEPAARLVRELAESRSSWAVPWPCLYEFLAIATHPRIYAPPSTVEQAIDQVDAWLESPSLVLLAEGVDHWPTLREVVARGRVSGALVHDARVAALCLGHGVHELLTADRDFGRFPSLRTRNPLTA
jgi:hypothetical protein